MKFKVGDLVKTDIIYGRHDGLPKYVYGVIEENDPETLRNTKIWVSVRFFGVAPYIIDMTELQLVTTPFEKEMLGYG